jgi:peptide/nickel transport system substrate-binding protein
VNRLRRFVVVAAATSVALSSAGAGAQRSARVLAAKADPQAILRYATDLSTFGGPALDPLDSKNGGPLDFSYDYLLYDTLVHVARDGSYTPGLAKSWRIVDQQTLELTLRPGVKFQDGTDFDAKAVKAGLERSLAADNRSFNPAFFKLDRVTVTAPLTIQLHLSEPVMESFFPVLHNVATMIPSPTAVQSGNLREHPVGAGPYSFDELVTEDHLSLRKFKGYWEVKAYPLAGVDFVHQGAGGPSNITTLLADAVDLADLSTTPEASTLEGRPGYKLYKQAADNNLYLMTMCKTEPPFDKLAVRQAVAMSIDREAINQGALDGLGSPTSLPVGSNSQFYFDDLAKRYPYNPTKAKKMLRKAGIENGFKFDLIEPPVPSFLKVAEVVQGQLSAVGFDTKIVQSTNVTQDLFLDNKAPAAVLFTVDPGLGGFLQYLSPEGIANLCHYTNPKLDAAFAAVNASFGDVAKAKAAWRDLETILVDDLPLIFFIYPAKVVGFNERVHGVNQIFETGTVNLRKVFISKG